MAQKQFVYFIYKDVLDTKDPSEELYRSVYKARGIAHAKLRAGEHYEDFHKDATHLPSSLPASHRFGYWHENKPFQQPDGRWVASLVRSSSTFTDEGVRFKIRQRLYYEKK